MNISDALTSAQITVGILGIILVILFETVLKDSKKKSRSRTRK